MATIVLQVTGMKCGGCENQVQDTVKNCPGISAVKASHKTATVEVEYDEARTDLEAVKAAIRAKGFAIA
jgi:copper chaperone